MSTAPPLLRLPQEIRDQIWDVLGHHDDYTALIHTCSRIRSEVLGRLPHHRLLCRHCLTQKRRPSLWKRVCGRVIRVDKLSFIVGAGDISKCYLRIEAVWKAQETPESFRLRKSVWSVRNRWSVFARVLKYYRAKQTVVVFEAPRGSFRCAGLFVALAKACETTPVVDLLDGQLGDFGIHFSEHGPGTTTAFWERHLKTDHSVRAPRGIRPRFYECILVPLLYSNTRGPYDARITFERPPAKKSMLLKQPPGQLGLYELNWRGVELFMHCYEFDLRVDIAPRWEPGMDPGVRDITAFFGLMYCLLCFYAKSNPILVGLVRDALERESPSRENPALELEDLRRHYRSSYRGEEVRPELPDEANYFPGCVHLLKNRFVQWASTTS